MDGSSSSSSGDGVGRRKTKPGDGATDWVGDDSTNDDGLSDTDGVLLWVVVRNSDGIDVVEIPVELSLPMIDGLAETSLFIDVLLKLGASDGDEVGVFVLVVEFVSSTNVGSIVIVGSDVNDGIVDGLKDSNLVGRTVVVGLFVRVPDDELGMKLVKTFVGT